MFRNCLKTAIRNLIQYKVYSCINIVGLAVGMASCILILLYVLDELNYDRYHQKADQIYRVLKKQGEWGFGSSTSFILAPTLLEEFPEIRNVARIRKSHDPVYIRKGVNTLRERSFLFADNSIFEVFTLPLIVGNPRTALESPHSIVLTR